jgi:hypothetical protein
VVWPTGGFLFTDKLYYFSVANLTIACGFNEFPSVQLVVYVSRVYGKTVEAIFQSLYGKLIDYLPL